MGAAIAAVLPTALRLPDPWSLGFWADAGWTAGRRIVTEQPQTLRELAAELPPGLLAGFADMFWRTVVATAAGDGAVRPERAALRYFGVAERDVYARAHCRGEQPRFVVRAAFDFTLWMALLSGSPIPVSAR